MDWAKAKTILIVVFLTINIFLGYMIIGTGSGSIGYVDSQKIQEAANYLADKKIIIRGEVPRKKTDLTSVTVKYKLFYKKDIVESLFLPNDKIEEIRDENILTLKNADIRIHIKDDRELFYMDNAVKPVLSEIDEKASKENIYNFLGKLGMKVKDMGIVSAGEEAGYKKYTFEQRYKGFVIYNSRMEFYVNDNGIYKASIIWFDTVKQANKGGHVVSSLDALSTIFDYYKDDIGTGLDVLSIEQGYYFGIGAKEQVDTSKIEEGTAFPVWKITTSREVIYINANNKRIEGLEKAKI